MYLINIHRFELKPFFGQVIPKYAILSHTWGSQEISFQDFAKEERRAKSGYIKIQNFIECIKEEDPGLEWAWVDTCCINKESSAELSEAINSMYKWYADAAVCHAYLDDVPPNLDHYTTDASFESSRWFTRGWTLQELLAPTHVKFFARDWSFIGDRDSLADQISRATRIQEIYLHTHHGNRLDFLRRASAAQKIHWASTRETTREEDIAYCLLGLLDVNMSLRYGEGGTKAFQRLQGKIYDPSILAWSTLSEEQLGTRNRARKGWEDFSISKLEEPHPPMLAAVSMLLGYCHPWVDPADKELAEMGHPVGLLATSPKAFQHCSGIVTELLDLDWRAKGQRISVILPTSDDVHPHMVLPCRLGKGQQNFVAVPLTSYGEKCLYRAGPWKLVDHESWHRWPQRQLMLSTTDPVIPQLSVGDREVVVISLVDPNIRIHQVHPLSYWVSPDTIEWSSISEIKYPTAAVFSLLIELPDDGGTFAILISRTAPMNYSPKILTFLNSIGLSCHVIPVSRNATRFCLETLMNSQRPGVLQEQQPRELSVTLNRQSSSIPREFRLTVSVAPTFIDESTRLPHPTSSEPPILPQPRPPSQHLVQPQHRIPFQRLRCLLCGLPLPNMIPIVHKSQLLQMRFVLRRLNPCSYIAFDRQTTNRGIEEVLWLPRGTSRAFFVLPWKRFALMPLRAVELLFLLAFAFILVTKTVPEAIGRYSPEWLDVAFDSVGDLFVTLVDWTYMSYRLLPVTSYIVPESSSHLRRYRLLISLAIGIGLVHEVDHTKLDGVWPTLVPTIAIATPVPSVLFYGGTRRREFRIYYWQLLVIWYASDIILRCLGRKCFQNDNPEVSRLIYSLPILWSSGFILTSEPVVHVGVVVFFLGLLSAFREVALLSFIQFHF